MVRMLDNMQILVRYEEKRWPLFKAFSFIHPSSKIFATPHTIFSLKGSLNTFFVKFLFVSIRMWQPNYNKGNLLLTDPSQTSVIYQNIKIIVCVFHSRVCETKKEKLFQRVKQIRNDQAARAQALNILPNSSPQQRPSSCVITFFSYFQIILFHYQILL